MKDSTKNLAYVPSCRSRGYWTEMPHSMQLGSTVTECVEGRSIVLGVKHVNFDRPSKIRVLCMEPVGKETQAHLVLGDSEEWKSIILDGGRPASPESNNAEKAVRNAVAAWHLGGRHD
ncbi:MAG: hypothetical protein Q7S01_02765 [bacterium]|nr:hypothetical protein [bacterium]